MSGHTNLNNVCLRHLIKSPGLRVTRIRHLASLSNFPELSTGSNTGSHLIVYFQQLMTISSLKDDILSRLMVCRGGQWSVLVTGGWCLRCRRLRCLSGPPVDTDLHRASNRASHIAHREEITQIPGHFSSQNVAQAKHSVRGKYLSFCCII